ncbi:MAG TPA: ATP-binding protein [Myxococcales bacterium]
MSDLEREARTTGAAERQLGRSALGVLILAALTAVAGPLLSYRSDVGELRTILRSRVARSVRLHADSLDRHVQLLQAELSRLAERSELDLVEGLSARGRQMLASTHHDSALFASGVAFLDPEGRRVWSEPAELGQLGARLEARGWFQRVLAARAPVADVLEGSRNTLVVAVPVVREGRILGALVGLLDALEGPLPTSSVLGEAALALFDPAGDAIFTDEKAAWARLPDLAGRAEGLLSEPLGRTLSAGGEEHYAAACLVGRTGLRLLMVMPEARLLDPMRDRFLLQLFFLSAVQVGAVLVLSLFIRRSYRLYLSMERRAARNEKLAALGVASSLIAHEVKNSLNGLNAAVSLLAQGADPALPTHALKGQIDRLRHLASSLLHFGRPTEVRRVPTDLRSLLEETVEGLKVLPEAADVQVSLEPGAPVSGPCDPLLLGTAVDNLVRNAIEAAASAKDLGRVASPRVAVRMSSGPDALVLSVEDNAGGPAPDLEERLFDPFVTGKPKGIGLGLTMARQAVEAQGGTLQFERLPAGSRFTIRLSLSLESPP